MSKKKTAAPAEGEETEEAKGGKGKMIIIAVVLLLVAGAAAYFLVLKPKGAEAKEAKPEPGVVAPLEPIQINLAGDHYLKLGLALQVSKEAGEEEIDGSKALDAAIDLFSGHDMADLARRKDRARMKKELVHRLEHAYHDEVIDVYFTDFVMQ